MSIESVHTRGTPVMSFAHEKMHTGKKSVPDIPEGLFRGEPWHTTRGFKEEKGHSSARLLEKHLCRCLKHTLEELPHMGEACHVIHSQENAHR